MRWTDLLEDIIVLDPICPSPDTIVLHLGGNDTGKVKSTKLLDEMKKSLIRIKHWFPGTLTPFTVVKADHLQFWDKIRKRGIEVCRDVWPR